jgi:hypothetical protein
VELHLRYTDPHSPHSLRLLLLKWQHLSCGPHGRCHRGRRNTGGLGCVRIRAAARSSPTRPGGVYPLRPRRARSRLRSPRRSPHSKFWHEVFTLQTTRIRPARECVFAVRTSPMLTAVPPSRLELPRLLKCNTSVLGGQNDANCCLPHLLPHVHQRLATASETTSGQPLTTGFAHAYPAVGFLKVSQGCMSCVVVSHFRTFTGHCIGILPPVLRCSRRRLRTLYSHSILHSFLPYPYPPYHISHTHVLDPISVMNFDIWALFWDWNTCVSISGDQV